MKAVRRIGFLIFLCSAAAFGYQVTWTVSGTFDDGGTLSGTFVFDADTGTIDTWNVVAGAGSTLGAVTYTPATSFSDFTASGSVPQCPMGNCIYFNVNGNARYLLLGFATALTDNGGSVALVAGAGSHASYECTNCGGVRYLTSGAATAPVLQTLTFDTIPNQIFGISPFVIAAQTNQLLPVTFTSTTTGVCTTTDDLVLLLSTGMCSITASQAGNSGYQTASATKSFTVSQALPAGQLTAAANSPFPVGNGPENVAVGDFNGDGKPDMAITNANDGTVTVLLGDGMGGFSAAPGSPVSVGALPVFAAVGDFNGDGFQDLAVAHVDAHTLTVLLGTGTGAFTQPVGSPFPTGGSPVRVVVGDFNGDGIEDVALPDVVTPTVTVLLGNGSGRFAAAPGSPFSAGTEPSIAVGDFNGDGIQDIAAASFQSGSVTVLLGSVSGGFTVMPGGPFPTGNNPNDIVVGDFNGDGIQDLATANFTDNTVTVLLGTAAGGFNAAVGSPFRTGGVNTNPVALVVADFNGDGIEDLAVTNQDSDNLTLLLGNGSGGFSPAAGSPFPVGTTPIFVSTADFNRDGIPDLAVSNDGSDNVTVLLGTLTPTNSVLSAMSLPAIFVGQPVPLSLNVFDTGTAFNTLTGTATFMDGPNVLGTANQTGSPYTFSASGLAVGSHALTAVYGGGSGSAGSTSNTVTIQVTPPLLISFSTGSISTVTGGSVSAGFSASGGSAPYTFSVSGQPAGVTLGSGSLSGSPTQPGIFSANVTVTDSNQYSASAAITINVLGVTTTALPNGTTGESYAVSIGAAGGTGSFSFSATGLPAGMLLTSYGYLNGTVKTSGTYPVSISVSSGGLSVTAILNLVIAPPGPLSISSALPNGTVKVLYSQPLGATGGVPPYTWSLISGAPPQGLSLSSSGIVSGTPGTAGSFTFGVQVTDTAGATATGAASIAIQAAPLTITTQSLPSGMMGVDYPQQQLTAIGGVAPYTWALASGSSLPMEMGLASSGLVSGVPAVSGQFSVNVAVTDQASTQVGATLPLTIRVPSPDLILTSGTLAFALASPAGSTPAPQMVGVQSTVPTQPISYTVSVSPAAPWLALANGTTTPDSITVSLTSAALSLSPGPYRTTITATCTSSVCSGHTLAVTVNLTVTVAPPQLLISTGLLSFATTNTELGTLGQPIDIQNAGGGSLGFASLSCEAPWCTAGPAPSSLGGGASAAIPVTVNPGLLSPGFYRTQVDITTSAGQGSVPVTLFISANATMTLFPAGEQFSQPAGGAPGNPNRSFLVSVNSSRPVNFSAAVLPGASWLLAGTAAGVSAPTQPGTVSFSIDPAVASTLAVGAYYGEIAIASADASNSPQDFEVVLNVTPTVTPVTPDPEPGGLLFIATTGGSALPPQTVTVYSGSAEPLTFQASAATTSGGGWLSVTPATGSASQSSPGVTTVSVDTSKLSGAGVYQGGVTYSLSATAVRTVNVTLIVSGGATSTSSAVPANALPRASGCTPSKLVPAQTGLVQSFFAPAGWPTPLAVLLFDDCGSVVNNGQIVATFSNGDPPLALPLANSSQGLYSGTWSPANASSQVTVDVTATAPSFAAITSPLSGAVAPNAVPLLSPNGTLHVFNSLVGGALAPGTIVAIYGQSLAGTTAMAAAVPLPTVMKGSSVIIGGMEAPLYYVSPGQIDAQIPFELQSGQQYQVIVLTNGALTTPQPIQLSAATPGLAASPDSTLIAQHSDGSLVTAASPAMGGEYLVAYLAGLGGTTVPVASGAPSPSSPLAEPTNSVVLTVNGTQSPIYFAGLTPGLVGLYQMNFQVPAGLPTGSITIMVSQNDQSSNQTVLPYRP
jgi:uncharacterized protein (TIGR03437 family)